ncbi:MAG: helicase-exonuclease AddAB subunit AddA [Clostridiales bacterium]|nr:helicase-exonuclease AddAB subunit AddA [Clostridiales bacterium]
MPIWTPQQQQAISARNHTILVSAAAGSGKTAVLIERIITLIKEGHSLDRMLIVTFTKAAAGEMRQRLTERLTKEAVSAPETMGRALDELESCEISTIHAFCQKVLRNHFQTANIDPLFRICEENDRKALFELAFCDAMNDLLEGDDENFLDFADAFDQPKIRDIASNLYAFMMSMPSPFDWLEHHIHLLETTPFDQHPWYTVLQREAARQIEGMGDLLTAQKGLFSEQNAVEDLRETWEKDGEVYQKLLDMREESLQCFTEGLLTTTLGRAVTCRGLSLEQKEWQKQYNDLRKQIKTLIEKLQQYVCLSVDKTPREMAQIARHLRGLQRLITEIHQNFFLYKKQKNVVDFNDLEQMTYSILQRDNERLVMQESFDHIFVDECQDVSAIQDAILQAIHGEKSCLFMVGDVKQSIYRFRLADPTKFLHRMRTFSDEEDAPCRRIFLQKNFRSADPVLDATNRVFRLLMRPNVTELDYLPEDELITGRDNPEGVPVEIDVIDTETDDDELKTDAVTAEINLTVRKIRELLQTPYPGEKRNYTYRDMVILLPKVAGVAGKMVEMLGEQGIPVYFDGSDNYFDLPEIVTVTSLLRVIDNPLQDIHLMAALKTIPFSMTDGDLANIRLCKRGRGIPFYEAFEVCCEEDTPLGERCRQVQKQLDDWHFDAQTRRISDFVWQLLHESGFYAACGALPKGEMRQANLRLLCQRAAEYEDNGGCTLSGFLDLAGQQQQAEDKRSAKILGENENLVRIMTMHKSKGLEFPVVFCLQLGGQLHRGQTGDLCAHSTLGVSLPYINRSLNIRRRTMADEAFDIQRKLDEKAERARLLYVAMTRARERLYLIGSVPMKRRGVWSLSASDYAVFKAGSMMDWIMQVVQRKEIPNLSTTYPQGEKPWNCWLFGNVDRENVDKNEVIHNLEQWVMDTVRRPGTDAFPDWTDAPAPEKIKPLKTSVTALVKEQQTPVGMPLPQEETAEEKRDEAAMMTGFRLADLPACPAFMEEKHLTGAQRGTLMHRALSLINLAQMRGDPSLLPEKVRRELHRMCEEGIFTGEDLLALSAGKMAAFFASSLGQRLLNSTAIRREWTFTLPLSGEETYLQGVIDCAFMENDGWVVLDYKTDRIEDEAAFVERYAMQISWYGKAVEIITGKKVKQRWLYALTTGKAYEVESRL